jgi:hypothetical protein
MRYITSLQRRVAQSRIRAWKFRRGHLDTRAADKVRTAPQLLSARIDRKRTDGKCSTACCRSVIKKL